MNEPNFQADEDTLFDAVVLNLGGFGKQHIETRFACFAFDCNPDYGEVLLCLDSEQNSLKCARRIEERLTADRAKWSYDAIRELRWCLHRLEQGNPYEGPLKPFNNNCGDFSHQGFATVEFPSWADYCLDDTYPEPLPDSGLDYLQAKLVVLFGKVIDRLVEARAFQPLRCSSPFYIGFDFHDGPQVVVRIIGWPSE